jgi:diguanylate cyclase (GGDEF)-like protein
MEAYNHDTDLLRRSLEDHLDGIDKEHAQEIKRLFHAMSETLQTDGLTFLPTRTLFEAEFKRLSHKAGSYDLPLSILMMDIDHFKQVNDGPDGYIYNGKRYTGHDAGDCLLRDTGQLVIRTLRAGDVGCRWGGEEILICLPNTDQQGAVHAAERLRKRFQERTEHTVSIGVTEYPLHTPSLALNDLVRDADTAMYHAKNTGRNKVVLYTPGLARVK